MPFAVYVREAVCGPLALGLDPSGDPGSGMHASLADVLAIGRELLVPRLLAEETRDEMIAVQFPGLSGVLPDHGRFDPLDWGLGVQLNTRPPTWMGSKTSARAVGHFGGSGTFVWVDPEARVVCAALTTRAFDAWAKDAWPPFADAVLTELEQRRVTSPVGG
jgi:CubicO group peptidase (beta-lactamase class C family)